MTYSRFLKPSGIDYDQVAMPTNPSLGEVWRERSATDSKSIVSDWWWNGAWLSLQTIHTQILLPYGQGIIIGGNTGSGIATTTSNHPLDVDGSYGIWVIKFGASFNTSGTLTAVNYWRLNLQNGNTVLQSLNITSGNSNEVTGNISKTSPSINQSYPNTGRYLLNLQTQGSAPTINNPSCFVKYFLVRP